MIEHIQLMILTGWNPLKPGGAGIDTRYFGTKGFITKPTDTPANTYFAPYLSNPGMFSQSMYSPGATGGESSGGFGVVELLNNDGSLDYLIDWGFDGFACTVLDVPVNGSFADASTLIAGTIEQPEHGWSSISFNFRDNTIILDKPAALHYYAGTNALPAGLEGVDDLKGKPKPRLFGNGVAYNIEPVLVNSAKLTYQCNDGAISSIAAVRDSGVVLTVGTAHANSTALQAATVTAGTYDTCLSEGYIRLGSSPAGQVTMDATASASSVGQTIKALAIEKLGATGIVEQSIIDLDAAIPATVLYQHYTGTNDPSTKEILDSLCRMGIWWGFDNNGKFWAKQFTAPVSTNPIATLTNANISNIERTATEDSDRGVPVWRVVCRYKKNNTIQTTLAGSVSLGVYDKGWLEAVYEDASIKTVHPLAAELIIDTAFTVYADALAEATRQFNLRSVRRDRLRTELPMAGAALTYPAGGYWDDEAISELAATRTGCAYIVHNNYLYLFGGTVGGVVSASVIRLDLSNPTGAWDDAGVTNMPWAARNLSAALNGNYVYISGGYSTAAHTKVLRLDVQNPTGAWDDAGVTDLPAARYLHGSIVYNNYLYVLGGYTTAYTASVIRLNLASPTGAWDDAGVTDMPSARADFGQPVIYNNYLYVAGGYSGVGAALKTVIRLPVIYPWLAWDDSGVTDLPEIRRSQGVTLQGSYMYVAGGKYGGGVTDMYASVSRLNLAVPTGVWENVASFKSARANLILTSYDNAIYSVGGSSGYVDTSNTWRLRNNDNPDDLAELKSLGKTILVAIPRYGYTPGRPMRIIGAESNYQSRKTILELWG